MVIHVYAASVTLKSINFSIHFEDDLTKIVNLKTKKIK